MDNLILKLYEIEAVKFGNFTLKSGISSPIYFDLRVIISYPDVMRLVAEEIWERMKKVSTPYKSLCGVPYTALPIATCISADHNIPMLIRRKEAKDYGTKKMIEGHFSDGDNCLIIEDVVTSGASVLETVKSLKEVGLEVTDAIVLLDRCQGGAARLLDNNIHLHSVCSVKELLSILEKAGKLSSDVVAEVHEFIAANNTYNKEESVTKKKVYRYSERAELCKNPLTRRLFTIMEEKRSNLALSADVTTSQQLIDLANSLGPYICVLKTHIDILEDFTPEVTNKLKDLAQKHNFLIFEDRKFADIGNTVMKQLSGGVYRISQWADLVNAHTLPGPGVITGLRKGASGAESVCSGCLLIAQMSSQGNMLTPDYTKKVVEMAESNSDFVLGFISQSKISENPQFLHMTPGVRIECGGDSLGQQYVTPGEAITQRGADIVIIGRGITESPQPLHTAKLYQEAAYHAYNAMFD